MTQDGWAEIVTEAMRRAEDGDESLLALLTQLLAEQDEAKAALQRLGIGVLGAPWPVMVAAITALYERRSH